MRINPLNLLLDKDFKIEMQYYFVSGNELSLIDKVTRKLIEFHLNKNGVSLERIDNIDNYADNGGLFHKERIIKVDSVLKLDNEKLDSLKGSDDFFIFISENSPKNRELKSIFTKRVDACLIDCYEVDNDGKKRVLNSWISNKNLSFDNDIYWYLIEKLDNRYVFLEQQLEKIFANKNDKLTKVHINKIVSSDFIGLEKFFFDVLKKPEMIVLKYNERIKSQEDVNRFYYTFKQFCLLIIKSETIEIFEKNIPKYLFKERFLFIDIYKKFNSKKKDFLVKLLFNTERVLRKQNGVSVLQGLRFVLSFKKILTS